MLNGELYLATDEELITMHQTARQLLYAFNFSQPHEVDKQNEIIHSLFGCIGSNFTVRSP